MMKVDKENDNINYNDNEHVYWDKNDNLRYTSVTKLIEEFTQDFDSEFFSKYKALEKILPASTFKMAKGGLLKTKIIDKKVLDSLDVDEDTLNRVTKEILDEWSRINKESCERGTKIHAKFEEAFYDRNFDVITDIKIDPNNFVCKKGEFNLRGFDRGVFPELMIDYRDGDLRLAGQSDIIVKDLLDIYVKDFKTNKKLDQKSYFNTRTKKSTMMKYPLNDLMDCNMVHYQIQLSTYAWMIKQKYPEFNIKGLEIIHFDHDGNETRYNLEYLPEHVERMIKWYKREVEHKEFLKKNAPVR